MKKKQIHKSGKQIIEERKKKNFAKLIKSINEDENYKMQDLTGKKVKLNIPEYLSRIKNKELLAKFMEWFDENKDKIFTVKGKTEGYNNIYDLEGVDIWMFNFYDLLDVETGKLFLEVLPIKEGDI